MVLYQSESGGVTAGLEAVPGCAAAPGQGEVRDTADASRLRLILFPPAPLLQTESRELREGVRAVLGQRRCRRRHMLVPVPFPSVKQAKQWIQLFFS